MVDTLNGTVRGYLDNVQLVDLSELVLLGHGSTCHTGQLAVKTEEVLECDASKSLGLVSHLNAFLSLDSLMQTVVEAASHHKTAGKLVNDNYLAVLDDIVDIVLHNAVCLQRLIDVVQES